jgi:hypothetical protein
MRFADSEGWLPVGVIEIDIITRHKRSQAVLHINIHFNMRV